MTIEAKDRAQLAGKLALSKKAEDLVILDMRKITNFCDYFVICSGNSQTQVENIAEGVKKGFLEKKIKAASSNGSKNGLWALLDYGDIIVHVFFKDVREYYNLERLWIDAQRIHLPKD